MPRHFHVLVDVALCCLNNSIIRPVYLGQNGCILNFRSDLGAMTTSMVLAGNLTYFGLLHQWLNGTKNNWTLCWRATKHGWAASDFHVRCDYKAPTVTIVQVGQYICGGFSDKSWEGMIFLCLNFSLKYKMNLL